MVKTCSFWAKGTCSQGDACPKRHSYNVVAAQALPAAVPAGRHSTSVVQDRRLKKTKTTSSFSVPKPYTLENATPLAIEVQYRYQFFYDISGLRTSDPARPYIFNMHEIKWCEASAKIMEMYNSSSEDRKLRRRIDRILDIHPINPMFPSDKDKDEEDPEESMRYESGGKPARVQM